jgi:hypothetical protein
LLLTIAKVIGAVFAGILSAFVAIASRYIFG